MWEAARRLDGIAHVDLYADYPRYNIDVDREQKRLLENEGVELDPPGVIDLDVFLWRPNRLR